MKEQLNPGRCFPSSVCCWDARELCLGYKLELMTGRIILIFITYIVATLENLKLLMSQFIIDPQL